MSVVTTIKALKVNATRPTTSILKPIVIISIKLIGKLIYTYTLCPTKTTNGRFSKLFTFKFSIKLCMLFWQNIPPHIHYAATLPCETKVLLIVLN